MSLITHRYVRFLRGIESEIDVRHVFRESIPVPQDCKSRRYFKHKRKNLTKLNNSEENPGAMQLSVAIYPLQNIFSKVVIESETTVTMSLRVSEKQLCHGDSSRMSSSSINI